MEKSGTWSFDFPIFGEKRGNVEKPFRWMIICNTKNVELVKSLSADIVIDYQTQDFRKTEQRFGLILDAVGKSSFKACKPLLTEKGIYISTELGKNAENIFPALFTPLYKIGRASCRERV